MTFKNVADRRHTPGPWAYEIFPYDDSEKALPKSEWTGLYIGPMADEIYHGQVAHTIFEGTFVHGPEDGDPELDAALMAAATEMFWYLRRARDDLGRAADQLEACGKAEEAGRLRVTADNCRAVIAKAEGKP